MKKPGITVLECFNGEDRFVYLWSSTVCYLIHKCSGSEQVCQFAKGTNLYFCTSMYLFVSKIFLKVTCFRIGASYYNRDTLNIKKLLVLLFLLKHGLLLEQTLNNSLIIRPYNNCSMVFRFSAAPLSVCSL